jgi:zinc protease
VALAGDVDAATAIPLVEELFGEIPAGPPVEHLPAPAVTPRPQRLVLEDRVPLPRLYLAWPSPGLFAPGDADLDVTADLLASGRTSRLYRRLVHERRIATELSAVQTSRELGGIFQVLATAAPGHGLDELESAVHDELGALATGGASEEDVERSRAHAEAAFVYRLESLGGFGGKADQLNAYNIYRGQPDYFARDLQRYLDVTPAHVRDAAAKWLDPRHALALSVVPAGERARALTGSKAATVA